MRDEQQGSLRKDIRIFAGLCDSISYMGVAWLRVPGTCGSHYFAGHAFIGWIILLVIAAFGRNPFLMQFWLCTGAWILFHLLAHYARRSRGYYPHSRYVGRSLLSLLGGNYLAICFWEPLLVFAAGYLMIESHFRLGGFFIYLAIAMFFSATYSLAAERATLRAMNDARADQAWLSEAMKR